MKIFYFYLLISIPYFLFAILYCQSSDSSDVIDLTKDIGREKMFTNELNIANAIAIVIIVMLLMGIFILVKILSRKKQNENSSFQILDKFFLDEKVTIYVLKIYGEIIKLAVSKGGVTYLGVVKHEGLNELPIIMDEGNGSEKLDASVNYRKVIDSINSIEEKISEWKNVK